MADTKIVVGEEVEVVLSFRSSLYVPWYGKQKNTITFKGKVIGHTDQDGPTTIRITGDRDMPVRVIPFNKILTWNGKAFKHSALDARKSSQARTVKIEGSKDNVYTLTIATDGSLTCSCPGSKFRGTCKHIDNYKKESA
jgi:hypothetical protein